MVDLLETKLAHFLCTHRVFVLLVEDEVKDLLGFVVTAQEGLPEHCLDKGDVGRHRAHFWEHQHVPYRSDQVFLVVVVWTRPDLPFIPPLLPSLVKKVHSTRSNCLPLPQTTPKGCLAPLCLALYWIGRLIWRVLVVEILFYDFLNRMMVVDGEVEIIRVFPDKQGKHPPLIQILTLVHSIKIINNDPTMRI